MRETRGPRSMVGVGIQDTRGLITGEAGLYKIPGVSSPGRQGYTRYQGFHHWGGGGIRRYHHLSMQGWVPS